MRAAVGADRGRARRRRRADQQRRLQPVGRDRDGRHGRRAPPVRDQRLRARAPDAARAAGDARAALGQDRERLARWAASFTFPGGGIYHATKYAVEAISDALRFEVRAFGVDVVVIQPGLIRTELRRRGRGVDRGRRRRDGARTAASTTASRRRRQGAYEKGPLAKLGGGPEDVAKTIERAISARRPKIRYRVTPSAHMLVTQRAVMTDGMWDAFLRTQFPQPGKD